MATLDYGTSGKYGLSYSRRQTLHSCPRKFEIENVIGLKTRTDSVTFSFGHAVAAGIQTYLSHSDKPMAKELAVVQTAQFYTQPWQDTGTASEQRAKKSVWYAINAVTKLIAQLEDSQLPSDITQLRDYEVPLLDGKPAIEVQFRILVNDTPDSYVYEGHIDLVLRNTITGRFAILELKTSSLNSVHDAMYANSDQALSYSIVLDRMVGTAQAAYEVIYLVYSSSRKEFVLKKFTKTAKQRVDWINNLIRDTEIIEYYAASGEEHNLNYPTNGDSCYKYFKPCEYFGICNMSNASLTAMLGNSEANKSFDYTDNVAYVFKLSEIVNSQVARLENEGYQLDTQVAENDGELFDC